MRSVLSVSLPEKIGFGSWMPSPVQQEEIKAIS